MKETVDGIWTLDNGKVLMSESYCNWLYIDDYEIYQLNKNSEDNTWTLHFEQFHDRYTIEETISAEVNATILNFKDKFRLEAAWSVK